MFKIRQKCLSIYVKTYIPSAIMRCFWFDSGTKGNALYVCGNMFSFMLFTATYQQYEVNILLSFHGNCILLHGTKNALLLEAKLPVTMLQK